jgi:hypothetical protein
MTEASVHDRRCRAVWAELPAGAEYWAPIVPFTTPAANSPGFSSLDVVGRLAPGATMERARAEFQEFLRRDGFEDRAHAVPGASATIESFSDTVFGNAKPVLIAMASAVALLFLITCINVGNLMLLRAAGRRRELAVRRAIGARYSDVARQLLVESVLISTTAGVIGLGLSAALGQLIHVLAPPRCRGWTTSRKACAGIGRRGDMRGDHPLRRCPGAVGGAGRSVVRTPVRIAHRHGIVIARGVQTRLVVCQVPRDVASRPPVS